MKKTINILFSFLFLISVGNVMGNEDAPEEKNMKYPEEAIRDMTTNLLQEKLYKDIHIVRGGGTLPECLTGNVWQYINNNVHFPKEIKLNRSDNSVSIHFIVEKDGSLNSFSIYSGSYPALDAEVLRVAKTMGKWSPGKLANGEIVRTTYLLNGVYESENNEIKLKDLPLRVEKYQGEVCELAEKFPQFPGGANALKKFISDNMQYPAEAIEYKEEGSVVVQFVVSPTGEIFDVFGVVRCRHNDKCPAISLVLAKEAERIVELMPNWIPGENRGEKVAVRYALPIVFKLP